MWQLHLGPGIIMTTSYVPKGPPQHLQPPPQWLTKSNGKSREQGKQPSANVSRQDRTMILNRRCLYKGMCHKTRSWTQTAEVSWNLQNMFPRELLRSTVHLYPSGEEFWRRAKHLQNPSLFRDKTSAQLSEPSLNFKASPVSWKKSLWEQKVGQREFRQNWFKIAWHGRLSIRCSFIHCWNWLHTSMNFFLVF